MVALAFYATGTTYGELNTAEQKPLLRNVNVAIVHHVFPSTAWALSFPLHNGVMYVTQFPPISQSKSGRATQHKIANARESASVDDSSFNNPR